jgi:hypothetical protein
MIQRPDDIAVSCQMSSEVRRRAPVAAAVMREHNQRTRAGGSVGIPDLTREDTVAGAVGRL